MKKFLIFLMVVGVLVMGQSPTQGPLLHQNLGTCTRFTSDRNACLQCLPHYHLFEGQCYIDIHGCVEYVFGNICRSCGKGFILVNNECCDRNCMGKIFKNYEDEMKENQQTQEEKMDRLSVQGYEKSISTITTTVITTIDYQFISTTTQWFHGVIRYSIKIMVKDVLYAAIADYELPVQKVSIIEFAPQTDLQYIREKTINEKDFHESQTSKIAFQYVSSKFGLEVYGTTLRRLSATTHKYGTEFRFIYIGDERAMIINVVVTNKLYSYTIWTEEREEVSQIEAIVDRSETVERLAKEEGFRLIERHIQDVFGLTDSQIQIKSIDKPEENKYHYKFLNEVTMQIYEETAQVDLAHNQVELLSTQEVISQDLQLLTLPETPRKDLIPADKIASNPNIIEVVHFIENVQPSLISNEITNAQVQEIGKVTKITLMQKKDDQTLRIVVMKNQDTNEMKLIDQTIIKPTKPTHILITQPQEGQRVIRSNNIDTFQSDAHVMAKIHQIMPEINLNNTQTIEKVEGNLTNKYMVVVGGYPTQQITIIENPKTQEVKLINLEEIPTPLVVEPIQRPIVVIPETQYQNEEIQQIIAEITQRQNVEGNIVGAQKQENKFVDKYRIELITEDGDVVHVVANVNHDDSNIHIGSISTVSQTKPSETITQMSIDDKLGVKVIISNNQEQIHSSLITSPLLNISGDIQAINRQEFDEIIIETVIGMGEQGEYIQGTFQTSKTTNAVVLIGSQTLWLEDKQTILPTITHTMMSSIQFQQLLKTNVILASMYSQFTAINPKYQNSFPSTTQLQQHQNFILAIMVFKPQLQRYVVEYNKNTKTTTIRESSSIPSEIKPIFIETDITSTGSIHIISNSVEEVSAHDSNFSLVLQTIKQKYGDVKDTILTVDLTINPFSNEYVVITKDNDDEITQMQLVLEKGNGEIIFIDVQVQTINQQLKPIERPTIQILPLQLDEAIIKIVNASIPYEKVDKVVKTENALTDTYQITLTTDEGTKTVAILVDGAQPSIIDVKEEVVKVVPSTTVVVVNALTGIQNHISTQPHQISINSYLKVLVMELRKKVGQEVPLEIVCFSEEMMEENVLLKVYFATHGTVSAYVHKLTNKVTFLNNPIKEPIYVGRPVEHQLLQPYPQPAILPLPHDQIDFCQNENVITLQKIALEKAYSTDLMLQRVEEYVRKQIGLLRNLKPESVTIEKFGSSMGFVMMFEIEVKMNRVVVVYREDTDDFDIIENPIEIRVTKPTIITTSTTSTGAVVIKSNSLPAVKERNPEIMVVIDKITKDISTPEEKIIDVVVEEDQNKNRYQINYENDGIDIHVEVIMGKDQQPQIINVVERPTEPIVKPMPVPMVVVESVEYEHEPIEHILQTINQSPLHLQLLPSQISTLSKAQNPLTTTYTLQADTPDGEQQVTVAVDGQGVHVLDYRAPQPKEEPRTSQTQIVVEVTGSTVKKTTDPQEMAGDESVQVVLGALTEQQIVGGKEDAVAVVTRASDGVVEVMVAAKDGAGVKAVMAVLHTGDGRVELVGEGQVSIPEKCLARPLFQERPLLHGVQDPCAKFTGEQVLEPEDLFPTVTISAALFPRVLLQDPRLQSVWRKVLEAFPRLQRVMPANTVMETVGAKVVLTFSFPDSKLLLQYQLSPTTGEVVELFRSVLPEVIHPSVFQTQAKDGSITITTNDIDEMAKQDNKIVEALVKLGKDYNFTEDEIKTLMIEDNEFTVMVEDDGMNRQISFYTEGDNIKVVDEEQFPIVVDPLEPIFTILPVEELEDSPQLKQTLVRVNETGLTPHPIHQILQIRKADSDLLEEFKVRIKTSEGEEVQITVDISSAQEEPILSDILIINPQFVVSEPLIIQEQQDPITSISQTIYQQNDQFALDESYPQILQFLEQDLHLYTIESAIKEQYGSNEEFTILLKNQSTSPQQITINLNQFNGDITLLQNRTLVSPADDELVILNKDVPSPKELILTTVEEQNVKIISQMGAITDTQDYVEVEAIKELEDDPAFIDAIKKTKSQFNLLLEDSIIVKVLKKETLDKLMMRVFFNANDALYESDIEINPITKTSTIVEFLRVGVVSTKSQINIGSDLAYGYVEVPEYEQDKNIEFLVSYLKQHYPALDKASIESVEMLELKDDKVNYKIFLKNGLETIKFIIFYEEQFQRVIQLRSYSFEIAGSYRQANLEDLIHDPYFRKIDQSIKEKHEFVAQASNVVSAEFKDQGNQLSYRTIYAVGGKTYHSSARIHKDSQLVREEYWNEIIEIPTIKEDPMFMDKPKQTQLQINDLTSNIFYAATHKSILSQEQALRGAQIVGATQTAKLFSYGFKEFYMIGNDYYQVEADYDLSTQKISIVSPLKRVNLYSGFVPAKEDPSTPTILEWLQRNNADMRNVVVMDIGRKSALMGTVWKVVTKLSTKFMSTFIYEEGTTMRILKEEESGREFPKAGMPVASVSKDR